MSEAIDPALEVLGEADGWDVALCACEWASPPCPDTVTAANFWAQHLLAEVGVSDDAR